MFNLLLPTSWDLLLEGAVRVLSLNLPGELPSGQSSPDVLLVTCGAQGQKHVSVSSLHPGTFGSAKPLAYLIAEPREWKFLGALLCICSTCAKAGWLGAKNSSHRCGPSSQVSFLLCDNYGFVMWPFWKRSSFVFQPQSHFPVSLSLFSLQLAGSWVVPWWFTSSSPDRSKWPVSYPPLLALVCTATL